MLVGSRARALRVHLVWGVARLRRQRSPLGWVEDMTPPVVTPPPPVAESSDPKATDAEMTEMTEAAGRTTIGPAWAHGLLERAPGETDLEIDEDAPLAAAAGPVDALQPVYPEVPATEAGPVAEHRRDRGGKRRVPRAIRAPAGA